MKFVLALGWLLLGCATTSAAAANDKRKPGVAGVEERRAAEVFGACVVKRSPEAAHRALTQDFRTSTYRNALRNVSVHNEDCMTKTGHWRMRIGNLPMAAALAEAAMKADPRPLNARLARAATGRPAQSYAPSDAMAMCLARSLPDQVAALFATEIGTPAEDAAATAIVPAIKPCSPSKTAFDLGAAGLRAIVATASYRLLAAAEGAS